MKSWGLFFGTLFLSFSLSAAPKHIPHLDLEMSSQELRQQLKEIKAETKLDLSKSATKGIHPTDIGISSEDWQIDQVIALGERLFSWLEFENSRRPTDKQLRLTSEGTRKGIPITAPSRYSPKTVSEATDKTISELPAQMKSVLLTTGAFPEKLEISDEDFIKYGRMMDRNYQTAARWKMLYPYRDDMAERKKEDVRGYFFLTAEGWTAETLAKWEQLKPEEQARIRELLAWTCMNGFGTTEKGCASDVSKLSASKDVVNFYKKYFSVSKRNFQSFFDIQNARRDISWDDQRPLDAKIPFLDPRDTKIASYLKDNIEDEYSWEGWKLSIDFKNSGFGIPHVVFETGVTPHVDELGGNTITMDANQPTEEYESQWTIRHEFGHVIGFPDCYIEFYETSTNEFVNYQIDTTDLMCSRAGNFNQRMYDEMKKVYLK